MPQPAPNIARLEFEDGTSLYGGEVEDRFGCDWIAPVDMRLGA